jgi:hypothetical protein
MEVVQALLAANADVNAKSTAGVTALMEASRTGRTEIVQALLAAKADVNAKMITDTTALMWASENDHIEAVKVLLAAGADVGAKDSRGLTAFNLAKRHGHAKVAQLLEGAGSPLTGPQTFPPSTLVLLGFLYLVMATHPVPIVPIVVGLGTFALLRGRKRREMRTWAIALISSGIALAVYAVIIGVALRVGVFFWGI